MHLISITTADKQARTSELQTSFVTSYLGAWPALPMVTTYLSFTMYVYQERMAQNEATYTTLSQVMSESIQFCLNIGL